MSTNVKWLFIILALSLLISGQALEQTVNAEGVSIQSCYYYPEYTYTECRDGVRYTYERWVNECDESQYFDKLVKSERVGSCALSEKEVE